MSKANRRMATITAKKEVSNPWFKKGWFAGALASTILLGATFLVFPQLKVMVQEYQVLVAFRYMTVIRNPRIDQ